MQKLSKVSEKIYKQGETQVFNMSDMALLIGVSRKTIKKTIDDTKLDPIATDERGNFLYSIGDYLTAMTALKLSSQSNSKFGGYDSAIEYKNAISARRDELKLNSEYGRYVLASDAERAIASCFADAARYSDNLLSIVDSHLHPSGEDMAIIEKKMKQQQTNLYLKIMGDELENMKTCLKNGDH